MSEKNTQKWYLTLIDEDVPTRVTAMRTFSETGDQEAIFGDEMVKARRSILRLVTIVKERDVV